MKAKVLQIRKLSIHDTTGLIELFYAHWTANNYTVILIKISGDTIITENVNSDI